MKDTRKIKCTTRFSEEEHEKLLSQAEKLGVTPSAYIRMLTLLDIKVVEDIVGRDILFLNPYYFRILYYELNRYGNNLNQAVHALHIIKLYCTEKHIGTRSLYAAIDQTRAKIEETLDKLLDIERRIEDISRSSYCIGTYEVR